MIGIVVSAKGYKERREAVNYLISSTLTNTNNHHTVLLDIDTIFRVVNTSNKSMDIETIKLEQWLDDNLKLDAQQVAASSQTIASDKIVVLDAAEHPIDRITKALELVSWAWHKLDKWHPAFVLVSNDFDAPKLARQLTSSFNILPTYLRKEEIEYIALGIMMRGILLKMPAMPRLVSLIRKILRR